MPRQSLFSFSAPEESPGLLLWQTTILWQRQIKQVLAAYDISHSQFVIMANTMWFQEQGEMATQIDIVMLSKLDKMTVSKALKKLATMNLIERHEHKSDTRAKTVKLTAKGKRLMAKLIPLVEATDAEFFSHVSATQQQKLIAILNTLATR
ncbi:MAG: winged helix-turn-helix transcriptional regulator [Gammaproteobacteria bacterium]|nr:winged helix-turn-helix transcriptional regulator [Gammaproteobacteria bacterium]